MLKRLHEYDIEITSPSTTIDSSRIENPLHLLKPAENGPGNTCLKTTPAFRHGSRSELR